MTNVVSEADRGYEVVFVERWVDLTVHGRTVAYNPSPLPVFLVKKSADAAIVSGKAVLPGAGDAHSFGEADAGEAEGA